MMNKLVEFFKNMFSKQTPNPKPGEFALGAFLNEPDNRDIQYKTVAGVMPQTFPAQITVTGFMQTQRLMQGNLGTCVEHSFEFIKRVYDQVLHSRRVPYVITRNALGWGEAQGQGLPQREAAKTATIVGTPNDTGLDDNTLAHPVYASLPITQAMRDNANLHKLGGFSFPAISVEAIKQALNNAHMVAVTIAIDWSAIDADGTVHPVKNQLAGYHEVVLGSSDDLSGKFRCANWWPIGDLYIQYNELEHVVFDAIIFSDIPDDLKLRARALPYIFMTDLAFGAKSSAVAQLQTRLLAYGTLKGAADGSYGLQTMNAVKDYQKFKGLAVDGKVGPATRQALNIDSGNSFSTQSIIDTITRISLQEGVESELMIAVAQAESGLNPNSTLWNPPSKSTDRGLYQWNNVYHKEIPDAVAFDPEQSCILACQAVKAGHLHDYWSASQPVWSKHVSPAILQKYGIV